MSIEGFTWEVDNDILNTTLFTAISGSYSFGWSKKDSDLDIRETWFPLQNELMNPFWRPRTLQWKEKCEAGIIDFVSYPLNIYLQLLNKGNGNLLENLFQPKMYENTSLVKELQSIVRKNIHKGYDYRDTIKLLVKNGFQIIKKRRFPINILGDFLATRICLKVKKSLEI